MQNKSYPESTYRVQFHAGFTFRDAARMVPYLADLGITHLYASPYLKAVAGSMHGYDVIDHCRLNPELGAEADFESLMSALAEHGMSHILDVVPNHVGIATNDNKWWNSVLAEGPDSKYGRFFDIAWDGSPRPELHGKVLMPLLGGPYNQTLEKGELKLSHDEGGFWINYFDRRFPISRHTLPLNDGEDPKPILSRLNGKPGDARSFDALHSLLEKQFYRLACWKNASDEINYRRFFDVNDLVALAMEREDVFEETHSLIFRLIKEGKITGLRLDHPDGLYDPPAYFRRLQDKFRKISGASGSGEKPLYLLAEKILAFDEQLPTEWLIHGTSGYDFLNMTNGLFVDARNEEAFSRIYSEWLGTEKAVEFDDLAYQKKKLILQTALASELHMLAHRLDRLAQSYRGWRDFTLRLLMHGLTEVIACFSVYRTYMNGPDVSDRDERQIERAIQAAIKRNPATDASVFHFIRDALLQKYPDTFSQRERDAQVAFAGKFQQLTSPTTAKGIEDTSFYIYNRFISLNEVGNEPSRFGISVEQLHEYFARRQRHWPSAMSALSTHDTKRSEDVRARLNVLSEFPDEWQAAVHRWRRMNDRHKTAVDGNPAPDANDEYLIYQTLLGAWPLEPWTAGEYDTFRERIQAYMLKALREAKIHTTWTTPNKPYQDATATFISRLLDRIAGGEFLDDFATLRKHVAAVGLVNSLSQTLLRLTAPGVPDTYQGTELWDFSLVDPDNRRPVDYKHRQQLLAGLPGSGMQRIEHLVADLTKNWEDGRAKLFLIRQALRLRSLHPGLFTGGEYVPLRVTGSKAEHVFAFLRRKGDVASLVAVPRLVTGLTKSDSSLPQADAWTDTSIQLPPNTPPLKDVLSGLPLKPVQGGIRMSSLFADFPVVLAVSG